MVGDAQLWYQLLKQENPVITWADFKEGFYSRYGPNQLIDYFGKFSKFQQHGTVQTYQSQFEKLLAKVGHLSQTQKVGYFVSGLIPSIRTDVQANRPKTLSEAIALARLYEARNSAQAKGTPTPIRPAFQTSRLPPAVRQPAADNIKRLTWDELNERKRLGLCFKCNEKFGPGHRCKKLFSIQAVLEDSDEDTDMEIEEQIPTSEIPAISLHAIAGFEGPKTMQLIGKVLGLDGVILVDSGSTHNFVSERYARKAGLEPSMRSKMKVQVTSGEELSSPGERCRPHCCNFMSNSKLD
uniref:Ty3 transposon capsid-like protein domain-containing protein n=1 Tax=Manihot esculenta TaxID=3983 RepID=A0A2C9UQL6_MANES